MTEEEVNHAFSPEIETEFARDWQAGRNKPVEPGLKPSPKAMTVRNPARARSR